jgi:hypothetical protein
MLMRSMLSGVARIAIGLALAAPAAAGDVASVTGTYALDAEAMRAAIASRPADDQERAKSALEFYQALSPKIILEPKGKGRGSFVLPMGDHQGETQTFVITWEWKDGKVIMHQPERKDAAPSTCVTQGKELRCNEGSALMIYVKSP